MKKMENIKSKNKKDNTEILFLKDNIKIKLEIEFNYYYILKKIIIFMLIFMCVISINYFLSKNNIIKMDLRPYKHYINDCKNHKRYFRNKINNNYPYITVCLPILNMEKYIEQTLLSIINQSFQDFKIIAVNDNSKDDTKNILKKMHFEDNRIKIINHSINKGVYYSRVEGILNANGNYIILMDPDDMFLNENLFMELYNYNLNFNLDIIEFKVYHQIEGRRNIYLPNNPFEAHYHYFPNNIIYQPYLSKILFKGPDQKTYVPTICRNIWNKMIKRRVFLYMHEYIGIDYFNQFVITADDMLMNLISYHYANNYSNIDLPGYLYNIRKVSMSRGDGGIELTKIRSINYFLYFKIFYKYIKQFKMNRRSLYYEMRDLRHFIYNFKYFNITSYEREVKEFLNEIIIDKKAQKRFEIFISDLLLYFEEEHPINLYEKIKQLFKK